jgi:hypothetical protein
MLIAHFVRCVAALVVIPVNDMTNEAVSTQQLQNMYYRLSTPTITQHALLPLLLLTCGRHDHHHYPSSSLLPYFYPRDL